ncbi:MAG TPA: GntR family transcriptional regulator [Amycolatopsis sp.]|uniref:GntR family transcriptional regulator n=1 Tax=Amycolatopsis sp. TaxID=37632 RepID=UPI002B48AC78|nr:GntR family transcriptional regulator [Amycolatopsis sp.]HKS46476.1 GntR family transcriptional regulator [Amycolatopsis sp.]
MASIVPAIIAAVVSVLVALLGRWQWRRQRAAAAADRYQTERACGRAQNAQSVRAEIADGSIRAGDRLPGAREAAAALGVGLHTILRGYQQLRDEGLVELRRGRGAIVTDAGNSLSARTAQLAREFTAACRHLGLTPDQTIGLVRSALQHR